ncbi:MAG: MFS transporter [Sphingomonadales bacterium]|nr:MFS transporter [Sphingomonadales bacterium]NCO49529.1 MFS transporter [Sphingomonadales bacterium]NCP01122.1 MFS transporter [Sphingomonadales bacterium]NCP28061.1 MFS transporter [Sphingomonadales bacterium]NCP42812.1 MFS transporter [Sphingomonadales bacterium]
MAVLFSVMLVTASGNTAMQSILPTIGTQLNIPDFWVSAAFSWSALLWVYTAPKWARQSDHRGRKALMRLGMIGFTTSFALAGLALFFGLLGWYSALWTFILFALFRSLYGGLGSAAPPAVQAYVAARTARADRTKALSLISSSFGLGTIVGPAIAPLLIIPVLGLSSPMFAFAAIGILVMVALALKLPNDNPGYQARGVVTSEPYSSAPSSNSLKDDEDGDDDQRGLPPQLRWGDERVKPWLITGILGGNAHALILGVIGFLVLDRLGLRGDPEMGIQMTGIVLMSGAAATLLAQWGLIPLLQMGPRTSILWGMVLGAGGCLIIGLSHDLHGIIIGFAVASLGFGLFRPGFTAGASLAVKRSEQNGVAGIVASVNGMAFIASPALGVLLYTYAGPLPFWLAVAVCVFLFVWGFKTLKLDERIDAEG